MHIKKYIPTFIRSTDVPSMNRVDIKSALLGFLTGMVFILILIPFGLAGFFTTVALVVGIVLGIKYILYKMARDNKTCCTAGGAFSDYDKDEYSVIIKKNGTVVLPESEVYTRKEETPSPSS